MKSKKDLELELNKVGTSLLVFMDTYNKTMPDNFPRATPAAMKEFRRNYPLLFKNTEEWSLDRHRKKFMDWHLSHRDI